MMLRTRLSSFAIATVLAVAFLASPSADLAAQDKLPPAAGPEEPRVTAKRGDDGIYHQEWFANSLLNLKDEMEEAHKAGKRFVVIFEQRGCIYCTKMHSETLALRYINDYVRANFHVVQLDIWGARPVTDFDGQEMSEKKLAERWGVMFTPTLVYYKDSLKGLEGKYGQPLEVVRSNRVGAGEFYDMFVWVKHKIYEQDRNFQRFHVERFNEREALKNKAPGARTN